MDELARELDMLRDELAPAWDEARSQRLLAGVGRLRRRRQVQRAALGACALLVTVAAAWLGTHAHGVQLMAAHGATHAAPVTAAPVAVAAPVTATGTPVVDRVGPGQALRLADGSLVQVSADGSLEVASNQPGHIALRLLAGGAHFSVIPDHERQFLVDAGNVQVAVLGTVFDVEHAVGAGAARVRVAVVEGRVQVTAADGVHFVGAGEAAWFGDAGVLPVEPEAVADEHVRAPRSHRATHKDLGALGAKASWRSLSQEGDYELAYSSLSSGAVVEDDPAALMDAADAARLSGHPAAAIGYLRRVVQNHRVSPVAPLAAFTLGRVLLERLGQPSEAAQAFAQARALAPHGSLAQDALAREVEALSKAGNAHEAYLRAQEYAQAYPAGRRLHAVRLYGGLD